MACDFIKKGLYQEHLQKNIQTLFRLFQLCLMLFVVALYFFCQLIVYEL